MMERKDLDFTSVITQHAKAGSADLYAMMPWCARIPKTPNQPDCEGYAFGARRACKRKATVLHIDLDGSIHNFCVTHLYENRISPWYGPVEFESPQYKRVEKWYDKCVEYTEKAKESIRRWNRERGFDE